MSSDAFWGKSKSYFAAAGSASLADLAKEVAAGNSNCFSSKVEGVESIGVIMDRKKTLDLGYKSLSLEYRAKHIATSLLRCPDVHLLSIFLVEKGE